MKEAIGNSFVFTLMMVFAGVMIALLVGSIAYTKGFKIRNRIIDIIEKHEGYTTCTEPDVCAKTEIDNDLKTIGYRIVDKPCEGRDGADTVNVDSDYRYCLYEYDTTKGPYYGVTVFIHIDIPLIGDWIEIPLYGETRILFDKDQVTG